MWNSRTWSCEKTLKANEGAVTAISILPTEKLALAFEKDRTVKT